MPTASELIFLGLNGIKTCKKFLMHKEKKNMKKMRIKVTKTTMTMIMITTIIHTTQIHK